MILRHFRNLFLCIAFPLIIRVALSLGLERFFFSGFLILLNMDNCLFFHTKGPLQDVCSNGVMANSYGWKYLAVKQIRSYFLWDKETLTFNNRVLVIVTWNDIRLGRGNGNGNKEHNVD